MPKIKMLQFLVLQNELWKYLLKYMLLSICDLNSSELLQGYEIETKAA